MSDSQPEFQIPNSKFLIPAPCYACLYQPPSDCGGNDLVALAQEFSPRYERHRADLVSVDVSGLERLLGPPRAIGEELRREAAARGTRLHVAIAAKRMAALVLAQARPGLTVVDPGKEAVILSSIPIAIFRKFQVSGLKSQNSFETSDLRLEVFERWGIKTLGELAALPAADLSARLGKDGLKWLAIARGEDFQPLVPERPEERFDSSLELEWPIEGLEPLSFVLTRLLEPLSTRLERRDRGAAVLHLTLRLVTHSEHTRRLDLPSPLRDVRALRTLLLLDLESHPPAGGIDRVTITIDPTPGRVLQHAMFTRAHPTPDQLSTLLARLGALMGQDRIGAPASVDSYRPGAFEMRPFLKSQGSTLKSQEFLETSDLRLETSDRKASASALNVASALRRCRQPVPARVRMDAGSPRDVTTDRRGFAGGTVLHAAGPWITSGQWWAGRNSEFRIQNSEFSWDREEWDVALSDGAMYRIFRDRDTERWFIDAIVD
jgi:protein ImuB